MFIENNCQFLRLWHGICASPIGHLLNCQTGGWSWRNFSKATQQQQANRNKIILERLVEEHPERTRPTAN